MRHLQTTDLSSVLHRGKSIEQFLGCSPGGIGYVRLVELRPSNESIELWIYDIEDIGMEDYLDLYAFPSLESDASGRPMAVFDDPESALDFAAKSLAAAPERWVNLGVAQSEYLDYIRAGRPCIRKDAV